MTSGTIRRGALPVCAVLLATGLAGCDRGAGPTSLNRGDPALAPGATVTPAVVNSDVAALRRATARFHRFEMAEPGGYLVLVTHPVTGAECLEHPSLGGMGFHYLNPGLADGAVSAEAPEVLIYEPGRSGEPRLVAVEYLVPLVIDGVEQPRPTLFGREFVRNETFQVWALHAWVWKHNPSGLFADWNPNVTCEGG